MYKINSEVFHKLELSMPEIFTREEASRLTGRLVTPNTLRNLDSRKKGPGVSFKAGKKVMYEKTQFINWLRNYCSGISLSLPSLNNLSNKQSNQYSNQNSYQQFNQISYVPYYARDFISRIMD
jgi:hypothetical protein